MKGILFLILTNFLILGAVGFSYAHFGKIHLAQAEKTEESSQEEAVEVGNKICPVSGEEIKEEEAFQAEHEGKVYNLCCKACAKDFKKDPQKYIEKLEKLEGKEEHEHSHRHEEHQHQH